MYINDDYLLDSARIYPQALDILLSAGMNPDTLYNYHTTLLFHAAGDGQLESIRILLAHGADPHIKDNQGRVAKNYAYDGDGKAVEHYKKCETLLVEAMNKT
ncbi:MAG: ankyrin repeat domain-containing protein [Gammaproteobacteria bacterium]